VRIPIIDLPKHVSPDWNYYVNYMCKCYDRAGIQSEEAQQWVDLRAWPNLLRVFISWTII
jgi:hypothetical protein